MWEWGGALLEPRGESVEMEGQTERYGGELWRWNDEQFLNKSASSCSSSLGSER